MTHTFVVHPKHVYVRKISALELRERGMLVVNVIIAMPFPLTSLFVLLTISEENRHKLNHKNVMS